MHSGFHKYMFLFNYYLDNKNKKTFLNKRPVNKKLGLSRADVMETLRNFQGYQKKFKKSRRQGIENKNTIEWNNVWSYVTIKCQCDVWKLIMWGYSLFQKMENKKLRSS